MLESELIVQHRARFSSTPDGVLNIAGTKPVLYLTETDVTNGVAYIGKQGGHTYIGSGGDGAGTINLQTGTTGSVTTKVRITSGGNVGIGITNPTVKLVSANHIKIQGEPTNVSNLIFTRSDRSWSINNETDFRIYTSSGTTDSPSSLVLAINGGGGFGVGTATVLGKRSYQ